MMSMNLANAGETLIVKGEESRMAVGDELVRKTMMEQLEGGMHGENTQRFCICAL